MTIIKIEEGNVKAFEAPVCTEMDKAITHFEKELTAIRTGKAHVSMIEDIKVECYGGSYMNLKEIASISAPDANMLTVQPWDKGILHDIEKALAASHLGVNPIIDNDIVRIEIPRMTSARREELSKMVGKKVEESKIDIRNVRKDVVNMIRDAQKSKKISEDFDKRLNKMLQDFTDKYVDKIDALGEKKKNELRAV